MNLEHILGNVQSRSDSIKAGCRFYFELLAYANGDAKFNPNCYDYSYLPFEDELASVDSSIEDLINDWDAYAALERLQTTLTELKHAVELAKRKSETADACVVIIDGINDMLDYVEGCIEDFED